MAFEVINILTFFGKSTDVEDAIRSFNVDEADESTMLAPNKVRFYSDQYCPYEELSKLSNDFPNVKIKVEFADEDLGHNVGSFCIEGGDVSDTVSPKGGSDEGYMMSMEITGDEFFVTDFLYGLEEDDIDEEFPDMCIRLAFKLRKCNSVYPIYVLTKFEEWAAEIEDYEFASEVSEAIKVQI